MNERQKVAWVTGGSRGIGQAIAVRLAADGFHVLVTYRTDESGGAETVRLIAEAGGSAEAAKADATSREEIVAVADRLDAERGGVDVLVNNAAVLKNGLFALMPEASWTRCSTPLSAAPSGRRRRWSAGCSGAAGGAS